MPEALDAQQIESSLEQLNSNADGSWCITDGKLQREFTFKNFVEAFGFMTRAAIHAEKLNHHPEWSNVYKTVNVELITHDADGLTELDFKLAGIMNKLAAG